MSEDSLGELKKITREGMDRLKLSGIKEYEDRKKSFVHGFLDDFNTHIEDKKAVEHKKGKLNPKSMQPDVWEIVQTTKCKTQRDIIKKLFELKGKVVNGGLLSRNVTSMRKKGYDIDDFLEK